MGAVVHVKLSPGADLEEVKRRVRDAIKEVTDEPITVVVSTSSVKSLLPKPKSVWSELNRPSYIS